MSATPHAIKETLAVLNVVVLNVVVLNVAVLNVVVLCVAETSRSSWTAATAPVHDCVGRR